VGKSASGDEKALPMPSLPQSGLVSRFHSNKMSLPGIDALKKMLICDERSQYVYENKGNMDKLTATKSDICGNMTWILQKNSGYDSQFALIDTLGVGLVRLSRRKSPSRQNRGGVANPQGPKVIRHGETRGKRDGRMFAPRRVE
jgi:hypothetical protein